VKRLVIAFAAVAAFALGSSGTAAAAPTLTLDQRCVDTPQYFNYDVVITVTGLAPFEPVSGSSSQPDGSSVTGTIGADASGTASLGVASIFPGLFTVSITSPFTETKTIYIDCGRPFPTKKSDCTGGGWKPYGFQSASRCFDFVREVQQCATWHYQGYDPPQCLPQVPGRA
jgi:hypothetical protein